MHLSMKVVYSMRCEVVVDFTRDYNAIREALSQFLRHVEQVDKVNLEDMLKGVSGILSTNWGTQNFCQIVVFTDCGIGFGKTSIKQTIANITTNKNNPEYGWLNYLSSCRIAFICLGLPSNDNYFDLATKLYQQFIDVSDQKGQLFTIQTKNINKDTKSNKADRNVELDFDHVNEMIETMCENNYNALEVTLKCGSYHKLECQVFLWPPPKPYESKDMFGKKHQSIAKKIEICGFLSLSEIGSPVSVSRHLIMPKMEMGSKKSEKVNNADNEFEKLEYEIRQFYVRSDGGNSDDEDAKIDSSKESVCVLLHGALKVESMAALILLNENWFGFIHAYADSRKKSNLLLNILPPGSDIIPWLGDLRLLGTVDDGLSGENLCFPVKSEKRSYSQNCVVWIKQAGLQSDIQKVLRHAKKLPEKTPHFYKELNRIRRAALSLGFIELLEGLANIFDRESSAMPQNANRDCALQLRHAANELRETSNRDIKILITPLPTEYNQL